MIRSVVLVVANGAILFLSACVLMQTVQFETATRTAKPFDHPIDIVDSQSVQNRPYKFTGMAQANAGKFHSPTDTVNRLKAQARRIGGDALLDLSSDPVTHGAGHIRDLWKAKIIVWISDTKLPAQTEEPK